MCSIRRAGLCTLIWSVLLGVAWGDPGDPAWPGHHPLTRREAGEVLIVELRCVACHADPPRGSRSDILPEKTAPDLTAAGSRISPEFLRRFLASPAVAHPGTTMPDLLASQPAAERERIAEALTHFLVHQSQTAAAQTTPTPAASSPAASTPQIDRQHGQALFHTIGCVACHGPRDSASAGASKPKRNDEEDDDENESPSRAARKAVQPTFVSLQHVASKYDVKSLSEFLFQPLRVRGSGRMPDMKLTPAESLAIAEYLTGEQPQPNRTLVPQERLVEQGRKYFRDLNCVACHALPGIAAAPPNGSLKTADLTRGCLSMESLSKESLSKEGPSKEGRSSPRFQLDERQLAAIRTALQDDRPAADSKQSTSQDTNASAKRDSDEDAAQHASRRRLAKTLTAFRCLACHVREDYGGVHDAHNPFFIGSELKLGDDGRIPPPLTLVGAKLQPAWMKKVLFDGESVRHYMAARMPQYGVANLRHLPDLFRQLDASLGPELKIPLPESRVESERERAKLLRTAGRELLGDKGVNCIACHNFNGKAASTNQGIDLLTSNERLQSGWFNRYLRNPGAFRPRTVMPNAWPDGQATFKTILDGDTDRQIEAIWFYLSLGTSAADPSGIRGVNTKLVVADQTVIHRGRSRVAGFRGIAVGLPEKLSYAFNAETGTLSALWRGEFIGVNWSGQGSGDFHPASEPITLAQDVSFARLADEDSPWPLLPVMTKEARTNPNPLYPKNVGYQFRGYFLDQTGVPTFQYRTGAIEVDDRSAAIGADEQSQLKRVLQFNSPDAQTVWFRALTGDVKQESERVFRAGRIKLTIPAATETKLRSRPDDPQRSELLLRLQLPAGKSALEFVYEPLPK